MRHILTTESLKKHEIDLIFSLADDISAVPERWKNIFNGKLIGTLFYEPSTRTRWSTEAAMMRLGGNVLSMEQASENSSGKKGESLKDTLKICSGYVDILAVRHPVANTIQEAAPFSQVPIINCGDGINEHPTQGLLDLYTITRHFKEIKNLKVMFTGDFCCSRTIHSLKKLLNLYEIDSIDVISKANILYMTRYQTERNLQRPKSNFIMTNELLKKMKKDAIIMHPLPRTNELPEEIDNDPRAIYFKQAKNGMWIRMALLYWLLKDQLELRF